MSARWAALAAAFPWLAAAAPAHPPDEYLQATLVSVGRDRVGLNLRLTPGAAAARQVLAAIDADGDGAVSDAEQRAYAERLRGDLSAEIDGAPLPLRLVASEFPTAEEFAAGAGGIRLEFEAGLPPGGPARRLALENRHQSDIAVYLVNCLVPREPGVRVVAQARNFTQSRYQVDFALDANQDVRPPPDTADGAPVAGAYFVRGVRHILTGLDHLLFAGALALAAGTLRELAKVVTAFTAAHSVTLTLAALGLVRLPESVVEPVIAASIVFVAAQNVLRPGSARGRGRLAAAFAFGLFHGLGFAGGLLDLMRAMPGGVSLRAILGFSVGVEAGHILVLAPPLGLLALARRSRPGDAGRARLVGSCRRVGSIGILAAGVYYLYAALAGQS